MKYLIILLCLVAAPAWSAPANPLGGKQNSKLPIAIASDALEVLQNENKAVFTGAVVATQGEMTLKSDKMVVYYKQNEAGQSKPEEKQSNVSKIDVIGNVFIASPQETAQGDKGTYDVDKKMIFLTGNVVLTKGKNVLRGSNAEYSVETGHSLMAGGVGATSGKPGNGRVRGLFVPGDESSNPANKQ